jgi:hypothetical protein
VLVNKKTKQIIAIMTDSGRTHDFKMYKKEVREKIQNAIRINGDSGFQGIVKYHKNSETPKKKTKKTPLTKAEKENNKRLASERILIEHINRKLKVFKIMSQRYRNRRKRYGLRSNLICGLYNFELGF